MSNDTNEQPTATDWRATLLLIFSLTLALMAFTAALAILTITLLSREELIAMDLSPLSSLLLASTLAALGALWLPMGYYSVRRLRGQPTAVLVFPPLRLWAWLLLPLLWMIAIVLASLLYEAPGTLIYTPLLHFLTIALPIYLAVRVAASRISPGSHLRAWGVLGSSMFIGPMLAITLELALVIVIVIAAALLTGVLNPNALNAAQRLVDRMNAAPNLDSLLTSLAPVIRHPLTLVAALIFLSGFVPFIEESAKSCSVWMMSGRLSSLAQGFALGVISGAGFALVEGLATVVSPDEVWGTAFVARAFSSLMHILAAGLTGLGIAYARLQRRYLRFAGLFALSILVHGIWNAGAVLAALGSLRTALVSSEMDLPGALLMLVGIFILFVMVTLMVSSLFVLNVRLRKLEDLSLPTSPSAQGEPQ
ncbi:MAG: hypothetical protein Fur0043_27120 [Anaerolineales bacterium]